MSEVLDLFNNAKTAIPEISYVLPASSQEIFMHPFTTKDQKAILKALEKEDHVLLGEAFDQLLKNCVTNKDFNPDDLLTKDRECLLIKLRQESVKEDFTYNYRCEECKKENNCKKNLGEISFNNIINRESLKEIELQLTDRDIVLVLGLTNRGDEKRILEYAKRNSSSYDISRTELINASLAAYIKSMKVKKTKTIKDVSGSDKSIDEIVTMNISFLDKVKMLENMSINDKNSIKKFIEGNDSYGYNLSLGSLKCKYCGHESDETMEWLSFFMV